MADQVQTADLIDAVLKDNQTATTVQKQYERSSKMHSKIGINKKGMWETSNLGRRYVQPLYTEPGQAYTRFATDARATASSTTKAKAVYDARSYIERVVAWDFDVEVRADGTGPTESFVNETADRISDGVESVHAELDRQTFIADGTGTLAACSTAGNDITLSADDVKRLIDKRFINIGGKLDVFTMTASVLDNAAPVATERTITDISSAGVITVDGDSLGTNAITTRAIALHGNRQYVGGTTTIREITSLKEITDTSTTAVVGGLDQDTERSWKGQRYDFEGQPFSVAAHMAAMRKVQYIPRSQLTAFADQEVFDAALLALGDGNILWGKTSEVEGRFRTEIPLTDGVTLTVEPHADIETVYYIATKHLEYVSPRSNAVEWLNIGGNGSKVAWDGDHGWMSMCTLNCELVTDRRAATVLGTNLGVE